MSGQPADQGRGHVIVVGNEKGGSGKSTTVMHLIAALLYEGRTVAALDLDTRQGTLTRYLAARAATQAKGATSIPLPVTVATPINDPVELKEIVADLIARVDIVVIDCPGSDTALSRAGHALADTLITPLNDSFLDFSVLGTVDPETHAVIRPSHYAEMVWEQRKVRAARRLPPADWIVMRNRLSALDARNKQMVGQVLEQLAKRIGFRLAPGFGERVIFRELFLSGLTLLDLRQEGVGVSMTLSHVAARQEIRKLLASLRLPGPPLQIETNAHVAAQKGIGVGNGQVSGNQDALARVDGLTKG